MKKSVKKLNLTCSSMLAVSANQTRDLIAQLLKEFSAWNSVVLHSQK